MNLLISSSFAFCSLIVINICSPEGDPEGESKRGPEKFPRGGPVGVQIEESTFCTDLSSRFQLKCCYCCAGTSPYADYNHAT